MQEYLPKLKSGNDNTVSLPSEPGVWDEKQGYNRMGALAKAIDVPPGGSAVHSVPDPWARVLLFARALYSKDHTLHPQVLGEWRGLLGLLGLRERMGMEGLTAYEVDLTSSERPDLFSSVLSRVLPDDGDELRKGDSWSQVYVLKYSISGAEGSGNAFAMTSPTTLVATGAYYSNAMTEAEVPWFLMEPSSGRKMLTDPTYVLSTEERRALAEWVLLVRAAIGDTETPSCGKVLTALKEFADDLDAGARLVDEDKALSQRRLGLNSGIANVLERPMKPAETHLSHLVIETAAVTNGIRYVLIEPDIAKSFRKDPKEVVVHRGITLATQKSRIPEAQTGVKGALEPNVLWLTPEFFFQKFLIYDDPGRPSSSATSSSVSNPFPGCRKVVPVGPADPRRILLPLNEEITDLFTADYLAANFSVEWKNNKETVCRLRLKLKSVSLPDEKGNAREEETREFEISKTYTGLQLIKLTTLPAVGVWPNVRSLPAVAAKGSPWLRYYLFESWRGTTKIDDFVVRPLRSAGAELRKNESGADIFQVHALKAYPDFLTCEMGPRDVDGYEVRPKALMILNEPDVKMPQGNRRAALGIDFGTTGTSIYWAWAESSSVPQQMEFKDRMLRVTEYDSSQFANLTRELMLPAQDWSTGKILSVYQVFSNPAPVEVLDGHVLFANDASPGTFITGNQNGVRSDLKWGDARQSEAADGFLTQLCFESLLELVLEGAESVDIRYSYPTAFSVEDKARFIGIWSRVIARVRKAVGIHLSNNQEEKENREAVAATRFFTQSKLELSFSRGALTMDIGGGTTDVALWSNDKENNASLMAHLSVKFAGRDIFLEAVRNKPEVLKILDPTLSINLPDRVKNLDAYNAQLDALISSRGDKMLDGLPGNEEDPVVKELLSIMTAGLCGIGFYTGLLTGRLAQVGVYVPQERLPLFVGGNGSRLLEWCAIKYFKPEMTFYKKLAASVLAGCRVGAPEVTAKVEITLSPKPKEEVAYGLVAYGHGSENELQISEDYTNPMAGESFEIRGAPNGLWSETPTAASVRAKAVKVDPTMPTFRLFLTSAGIRVSNRTLTRVADRINDQLATMGTEAAKLQGADADQHALDPLRKEPIFIMAVKALLHLPIGEWERNE
ncbi:hypothetical protein [Granulicella arctica]|uniref:hypothetical protein n=1 Tax=Granulicella arctica TaxID=940613 RepID=UPI0021DF72EA|nr:hypothetical protein [Granulicella arctica]